MMYDQGNEDKYDGWGVKMPQQEFHLLRLKVWENALDYSIDHADIATEPIPSGAHALGFTIGEFLPGRKPNQMRVRNVRIRRADWGPPPTLTDADAFIAFNLAERDNDPLDPNAWSNLATGHLAKRDFKSALAAIEGCERLNPQHVNTGYVHGHILLSKGDYAAAIPHYRRSIERKPNHMESHSNLAWILAAAPVDSVRDPEEALMLAQRACALANYEHWMPLTALAGAHAERGEFEAARKWIALALELAPENSREITLKRQAEIGAGRPLRDEPTLPTSESTPAQPADAASPPSPTAGESADVSSR